jgi:hypothetical protein
MIPLSQQVNRQEKRCRAQWGENVADGKSVIKERLINRFDLGSINGQSPASFTVSIDPSRRCAQGVVKL